MLLHHSCGAAPPPGGAVWETEAAVCGILPSNSHQSKLVDALCIFCILKNSSNREVIIIEVELKVESSS